jgi:hypothetical protein
MGRSFIPCGTVLLEYPTRSTYKSRMKPHVRSKYIQTHQSPEGQPCITTLTPGERTTLVSTQDCCLPARSLFSHARFRYLFVLSPSGPKPTFQEVLDSRRRISETGHALEDRTEVR